MDEESDWVPERNDRASTKIESLVIRTYRKILLGRKDCPSVFRDFVALFGDEAQEIYLTFCTLLCAVAYASRRGLSVGHPGCGWLTGDERQLLALISATQAEDAPLLEAHLRWLTRAELRGPLTIALNAVARAL